jgi:hypothetical protein
MSAKNLKINKKTKKYLSFFVIWWKDVGDKKRLVISGTRKFLQVHLRFNRWRHKCNFFVKIDFIFVNISRLFLNGFLRPPIHVLFSLIYWQQGCNRIDHRHKRIDRLFIVLFWLSRYVASPHLAVVPQSGAKDQFYCTVYYITLNSNCEAQWVSKKGKNVGDRVRSQT